MKNPIIKPLLSLCLLWAFTMLSVTPTHATGPDRTPEEMVDSLIAGFDKDDSPGGAILVMRGNEVIYSRGFGMANPEYGIPFTGETPTNIGSTAKQFTALAIAMLEEQGKLSIQDDIRKYIPEVPAFEDTVRIKHLIAHTSGYREFLNTLAMGGWRMGDHIGRQEVFTVLQGQPELQNKPGEVFNYNNSGYALLATVVERVTDKAFPEWMQAHIFGPLGMEQTLVMEYPGQLIPRKAFGYERDEQGRFKGVMDIYASMGAGGIYASVQDLAKWAANYYDPVVGDEALMDRMQQEFLLNSGEGSGYAFGLMIEDLHGQKMIHHPGGDRAHRSQFMLFPEIQGMVTVQSNYSGFPGQVAQRVAEAFFADVMDKEEVPHAPADDLFVYRAEDFDELAGRYELEAMPGFVMEFTREDETFYARATGQPRFEVFPSSDSTFYLTVVEASITFHRNAEGEVYAMTLHQNGDHFAHRITEPLGVPGADDLAMYTGRYFSRELETFYTLLADEDGELRLTHRRLDDIPLKAESKDRYTGSFPITRLTFVRDEQGQVTGFSASSGRATGIFFDKVDE